MQKHNMLQKYCKVKTKQNEMLKKHFLVRYIYSNREKK